ncbi:19410_t:CDS:2, partial [Gigaspora margarita]
QKVKNIKRFALIYDLLNDYENNGPSNQDDVDNESNPDDKLNNEYDDELYSENVSDNDSKDMMDFD